MLASLAGNMHITPFSISSRTSVHALRHYEAIGLLVPKRLPGNRYRDYAPEQAREAVFITMSRHVGIGLALIAALQSRDLAPLGHGHGRGVERPA